MARLARIGALAALALAALAAPASADVESHEVRAVVSPALMEEPARGTNPLVMVLCTV